MGWYIIGNMEFFFFFPYKGEGNYSKMYLLIEELFLFQTRLIFSAPFIKSQSVLMNLNIDMK